MLSWLQTLTTAELIALISLALSAIAFTIEHVFAPIRSLKYKRAMQTSRRIKIEEEYNYLEAIHRKLEQLNLPVGYQDEEYTRLSGRLSDSEMITARYFVSPQSESAEPEIDSRDLITQKQGRFTRNIIKTLLGSNIPLVLLGDPGSGKSVTLRHIGMEVARRELMKRRISPKLPVYVHLSQYTSIQNGKPEPLLKFLVKYLENFLEASKPITYRIEEILRQRRFVFLFDSIDEMPSGDYAERVSELREFSINYGGNKCLFACRKLDYDPRFRHREVAIEPFGTRQRREFLKKNIKIYSHLLPLESRRLAYRNLKTVLDANHPLSELTGNPFFLKLIARYFFCRNGRLPRRRAELFEDYMNDFLRRERARAGSARLPADEEVLDVLARVAYIITSVAQGTTISEQNLVLEFRKSNTINASKLKKLESHLQSCINMAVQGGLLIKLQDNRYRFEHHRFQEYLTACYMDRFSTDFCIEDYVDNLWWQEVLIMLVGITDKPEIVVDCIITSAENALTNHEEEQSQKSKTTNSSIEVKTEWELKSKQILVVNRIEFAAKCLNESKRRISQDSSLRMLELIRPLMNSTNPLEKVKAIRAAGWVGSSASGEILSECLKDQNPWVRSESFSVILRRGLSQRDSKSNAKAYMWSQFRNRQMLRTIPEFLEFFCRDTNGRRLIPIYMLLLVIQAFWLAFPLIVFLAIIAFSKNDAIAFKKVFLKGDLSALHIGSMLTIWIMSFLLSLLVAWLIGRMTESFVICFALGNAFWFVTANKIFSRILLYVWLVLSFLYAVATFLRHNRINRSSKILRLFTNARPLHLLIFLLPLGILVSFVGLSFLGIIPLAIHTSTIWISLYFAFTFYLFFFFVLLGPKSAAMEHSLIQLILKTYRDLAFMILIMAVSVVGILLIGRPLYRLFLHVTPEGYRILTLLGIVAVLILFFLIVRFVVSLIRIYQVSRLEDQLLRIDSAEQRLSYLISLLRSTKPILLYKQVLNQCLRTELPLEDLQFQLFQLDKRETDETRRAEIWKTIDKLDEIKRRASES